MKVRVRLNQLAVAVIDEQWGEGYPAYVEFGPGEDPVLIIDTGTEPTTVQISLDDAGELIEEYHLRDIPLEKLNPTWIGGYLNNFRSLKYLADRVVESVSFAW